MLLLVSFPVLAAELPVKEMSEGKCMGCKPQMVATDEGGVFVLAGNKLIKYDADLNIEKEVEVKMPMGGKMCPMMKAAAEGAASTTGTEKKVS